MSNTPVETCAPEAESDNVSSLNEKRSNETQLPPTPRQQALGIALVIGVAIIWTASAELMQFIFGDSNYNKPYTVTYISLSMLSTLLLGFLRSSWRKVWSASSYKDVNKDVSLDPQGQQLSTFTHTVTLAAALTPFFFLCQWTFNLGLVYTSVASSSIIATLTSLFTLAFGAISGVERFSYPKLIATLLSILGVSLIVIVDDSMKPSNGTLYSKAVLGDLLSILSASLYATYAIILKYKAGPEGSTNVAMVLGIVGAFVTIATWPGIFIVHWLGIEKFEWPSKRVHFFLFINGMIGTVLSEVMWAMSIVLTTPMTTTLALSMTVPLSMCLDVIIHHKSFGVEYAVGAALVIIGFVIANIDVASSRRQFKETSGTVATDNEL